jgi:hypothetical protein
VKKTILEVYALAVCFFTVACFAICLGIGLYDIVQIAAPEFTLNKYQFQQYQSNEGYRHQFLSCSKDKDKEAAPPSEAEVTKQREEAYSVALRSESHEGIKSLVQMLATILVDIIVFFVHWRIARRARESAQA